MQRIIALLEALRAGAALADPAAWKRGQNTLNLIVAALAAGIAAAGAFGYAVPVGEGDLTTIAAAIVSVVGIVNGYITTATTNKIGLGGPK